MGYVIKFIILFLNINLFNFVILISKSKWLKNYCKRKGIIKNKLINFFLFLLGWIICIILIFYYEPSLLITLMAILFTLIYEKYIP